MLPYKTFCERWSHLIVRLYNVKRENITDFWHSESIQGSSQKERIIRFIDRLTILYSSWMLMNFFSVDIWCLKVILVETGRRKWRERQSGMGDTNIGMEIYRHRMVRIQRQRNKAKWNRLKALESSTYLAALELPYRKCVRTSLKLRHPSAAADHQDHK